MENLDPFSSIKPNESSIEKINTIRTKTKEFYHLLMETVPSSREKSIVMTKLEELAMWANKGIVFNQDK